VRKTWLAVATVWIVTSLQAISAAAVTFRSSKRTSRSRGGGIEGNGAVAEIRSFGNAVIEIHGHSFAVDGVPIAYGDLTAMKGRITGVLASGELLDNTFERQVAASTIRLIMNPEPGTGLMLGAGLFALALRCRSRSRS
jgi:hypothetical protein